MIDDAFNIEEIDGQIQITPLALTGEVVGPQIVQPQEQAAPAPPTHNAESIGKLLYKIENCINWDMLFALEDEFNCVGLTIQPTTKNRMILCKIFNGKPIANSLLDDYIFLTELTNKSKELSDKEVQIITDFCRNAAANPDQVNTVPRKWQQNTFTYGHIMIVNEDIDYISQCLID